MSMEGRCVVLSPWGKMTRSGLIEWFWGHSSNGPFICWSWHALSLQIQDFLMPIASSKKTEKYGVTALPSTSSTRGQDCFFLCRDGRRSFCIQTVSSTYGERKPHLTHLPCASWLRVFRKGLVFWLLTPSFMSGFISKMTVLAPLLASCCFVLLLMAPLITMNEGSFN